MLAKWKDFSHPFILQTKTLPPKSNVSIPGAVLTLSIHGSGSGSVNQLRSSGQN